MSAMIHIEIEGGKIIDCHNYPVEKLTGTAIMFTPEERALMGRQSLQQLLDDRDNLRTQLQNAISVIASYTRDCRCEAFKGKP